MGNTLVKATVKQSVVGLQKTDKNLHDVTDLNKSPACSLNHEEMCEALKKFYLKTYGKMDEIVHLVKTPAKVEFLNKYVELTVVDEDEVEKDTVNIAERELFLKRQLTYQPIDFKEVFSKERSLLLISGVSGIGKTCLLRKCLLDWANGTLWKNVNLVFYLECRKLNQHQNISNINELLKVFYKEIFQESDVCNHFSILFVIDGLDEFAHIDELINYKPQYSGKQPIINALAEALNTQKYKCVVAGRVGAISQYKEKVTECADKLTIQIMGFNENGINEYVENIGEKKDCIKSVLKESYLAKAMASVPFNLSAMCSIIAASDFYSFNTMTELYCSIFLYFFQKHICKTNEAVHEIIQNERNKQNVLRVCRVAWELFNQGKIIFFYDEIKSIVEDFDKVENELLGFIERVESQLGYQYQFAHFTLMEFCASVHAHIYLSPKEIISSKKLRSCLPMICGLANENKTCFVRFLRNLKKSDENRNSLLNAILALLPKYPSIGDDQKMFMECLFEAQPTITGALKRSIEERKWWIVIGDVNTAHEVLYEIYFLEKLIEAECKLHKLFVVKSILSEEEKSLLILCLTNVCEVSLYHPVNIDGLTLKYETQSLRIHIYSTIVKKNEFKGFLPWIRLAEELSLDLHEKTDFIDEICEWIGGPNIKWLEINFRGKKFYQVKELKLEIRKNI